VGRNHPKIAPRALFQSFQARLEIADFRSELTIALDELVILGTLRCHSPFETIHLAYAILG